jgi:hypothetical protein
VEGNAAGSGSGARPAGESGGKPPRSKTLPREPPPNETWLLAGFSEQSCDRCQASPGATAGKQPGGLPAISRGLSEATSDTPG